MTWEGDDPLEPGEDADAGGPAVTIEVTGLSLYTRHGVSEAERELGQRLVFDVAFDLDECDATVTDRVELVDRKSTRLNSSHALTSRMPSSA